jgi:hypothetical protein
MTRGLDGQKIHRHPQQHHQSLPPKILDTPHPLAFLANPARTDSKNQNTLVKYLKYLQKSTCQYVELAMNQSEVDLSLHKMGSYQDDIINVVSAVRHVKNRLKLPAFTSLKIDRIVNAIITNSIIQHVLNAVKASKDNVCNWKILQFDILVV